jgi:exocyst complex component 4
VLLSPLVKDVLETVRRKQIFSFDEYRSILKLQCGVDQTEGDAQAKDKTYSTYAIDLHRLELAAVQ